MICSVRATGIFGKTGYRTKQPRAQTEGRIRFWFSQAFSRTNPHRLQKVLWRPKKKNKEKNKTKQCFFVSPFFPIIAAVRGYLRLFFESNIFERKRDGLRVPIIIGLRSRISSTLIVESWCAALSSRVLRVLSLGHTYHTKYWVQRSWLVAGLCRG